MRERVGSGEELWLPSGFLDGVETAPGWDPCSRDLSMSPASPFLDLPIA